MRNNKRFLGQALACSPFFLRKGKKGQSVNFPMILVIGLFGLVTVWGLLGGLQGVIGGVTALSVTNAETKFVLLLVPFVLVFSIIFWTVYYVRGGSV